VKLGERLRRELQLRLAREWSFVPQGRRVGGAAQHLLVIAPRCVPTIDYYLDALLTEYPAPRGRVVYDDQIGDWLGPSPTQTIQQGTRVILVRMPAPRWAQLLDTAADGLVEVVWLLDDDVTAARGDAWLPSDYRLRLLTDYLTFKSHYEAHVDRVWASTPQVASRFPEPKVELHPPHPPRLRSSAKRPIVVFYHATAAHRREQSFLLPIFHEVQRRSAETVIEVVGDQSVYRSFRGVPRLRVIHPMPWPDYLVHLRAGRYDLGLAPLLDTPFNRGRSGVKALEIAACGAQGLLSRRAPYTDYAHLPGMQLVGDDPSEWVQQILNISGALVQERPLST
jgi:hypothetical protein